MPTGAEGVDCWGFLVDTAPSPRPCSVAGVAAGGSPRRDARQDLMEEIVMANMSNTQATISSFRNVLVLIT
jgi:hypothetical protein